MISHSKPTIGDDTVAALDRTLHSGQVAGGPAVAEFERRVAAFLGLEEGVAVASGTSALVLALKSLNVGQEDEVVIPTYVCGSLLAAVRFCGAVPVVCDAGRSWNVTIESVSPCLTKRTKAVIVPYLYGIPIPGIEEIADAGVPVIEDIAQSFGTRNPNGRMAGATGDLCVCSFHATKCLTTGEGGMVLSNDRRRCDAIRELGPCCPMSDVQASIGLSQLDRYGGFIGRRREIAARYFNALDGLGNVCLPRELRPGNIFFRFVLKLDSDFDRVKNRFADKGIAVRQGVDSLIHRRIGLPDERFPVANDLYLHTTSLPIYPSLSDDNVGHVADAAREIILDHRAS